MTAYSIIVAVTWLLAGALMLWVGVKAGQGTLTMNNLVGIKTATLLRDEETWTTGHKAAAGYLKASGVPMLIGGIACLFVDDALIGWLSIPAVLLLLAMIFLATRKAHAAVADLQ
ncbi:SdpI family protein [Corynebacterium camporealensis]